MLLNEKNWEMRTNFDKLMADGYFLLFFFLRYSGKAEH